MSDQDIVVAPVKAVVSKKFGSSSMFDKVRGLSEDSPMKRMKSNSRLRLSWDNGFRIKRGGETIQTIKDGRSNATELDVVIHCVGGVGFSMQKEWKIWDDTAKAYEFMGCWANGQGSPDDDVWNKQSESCDTCPRGGNGDRECGLTKTAMVSLYAGPDEDPANIQLMDMNFNWTSFDPKKGGEDMEENILCLKNYLNLIATEDTEIFRVVTRLIVDDSDPKNKAKILFQPIDVLPDGQPNYEAHKKWTEEDGVDLEELCKIRQYKPADQDDSKVGDEAGAEDAPTSKKTSKKKTSSKKTTTKKAPASKKAGLKKKKSAPPPPPVEEFEEEDEFEEEEFEEEYEEAEEEFESEEDEVDSLVPEDDDDFGEFMDDIE